MGICRHLRAYAGICGHLRASAGICGCLWASAGICRHCKNALGLPAGFPHMFRTPRAEFCLWGRPGGYLEIPLAPFHSPAHSTITRAKHRGIAPIEATPPIKATKRHESESEFLIQPWPPPERGGQGPESACRYARSWHGIGMKMACASVNTTTCIVHTLTLTLSLSILRGFGIRSSIMLWCRTSILCWSILCCT